MNLDGARPSSPPLQVAQALRDRCQHFLAEQLPEHQLDVARAAGTLAAFNESNGRSTDEDMPVDEYSPVADAGMPLAEALLTRILVSAAPRKQVWVVI